MLVLAIWDRQKSGQVKKVYGDMASVPVLRVRVFEGGMERKAWAAPEAESV